MDLPGCQMDSTEDQIDKKILESIFGPHKSSFLFQEKLALEAKKKIVNLFVKAYLDFSSF